MKKILLLTLGLAALDLLMPSVSTGAQVAIAPAIIAAIIGLVGSAAAAQKQQQGAQSASTAAAADKSKGSMSITPTVKYDPEKATEANKQAGYNPYTAAGGGTGMNAAQLAAVVGGKPNKMQDFIEQADSGLNAGSIRNAQSVIQPGQSVEQSMQAAIAKGVPEKKPGMSFDDKMQMASLVASLGSALSGPGAPPPPGAPRGGGIGMSPVFQQMTARNLYG